MKTLKVRVGDVPHRNYFAWVKALEKLLQEAGFDTCREITRQDDPKDFSVTTYYQVDEDNPG